MTSHLPPSYLLLAAWKLQSPTAIEQLSVNPPKGLETSFWGQMLHRILAWERSGATEAEIEQEISEAAARARVPYTQRKDEGIAELISMIQI